MKAKAMATSRVIRKHCANTPLKKLSCKLSRIVAISDKVPVGDGTPEYFEPYIELESELLRFKRFLNNSDPLIINEVFRRYWWQENGFSGEELRSGGNWPQFEAMLKEAFENTQKVLRRPNRSANRNWCAVLVAKETSTIWGLDEWCALGRPIPKDPFGLDLEGDKHLWQEFQSFVNKSAPITQNRYHPGPFGRFLEEMFGVLDIFSPDGNVVTAACALASLREISHHGKIRA